MHNLSNATYFQKRYHDKFCPNDIIVYTYYGEILTANFPSERVAQTPWIKLQYRGTCPNKDYFC